jgi:hypothetical protein
MMTAQPTPSRGDRHLHLAVVDEAPAKARPKPTFARLLGERWVVVSLAAGAVGLYISALFATWWDFWLFAPQYPNGLRIYVGLRGMTGDVREVDLLNHYIGMKHLEDAAPFERHYAAWGVGLLGFMVLLFTLVPGKRLSGLLMIPALLFPLTFIGDSLAWLWSFGHHLDPHAPLHFKPFTPHMFGLGIIGQFSTYAIPDVGFWLAVGGIVLLFAAVLLRRRVCKHCGKASSCGGFCPRLFVGPGAGKG